MQDNSRVNAGRERQGTKSMVCPLCGSSLQYSEGEQASFCSNPDCPYHDSGIGTRQGTKSASMFPTFSAPSQASAERIAGILAQRQIESKIVGRKDSVTVYVPTKLVNRAVSIVFGLE
jgi:hypothetical protein